jgi:hypothetical protein
LHIMLTYTPTYKRKVPVVPAELSKSVRPVDPCRLKVLAPLAEAAWVNPPSTLNA